MKGFGLLCLFLLIGAAAFMYLGYSIKGSTSLNPGVGSIGNNAGTLIVKSRKLKEFGDPHSSDENDEGSHVNLEDYRPFDPVPSSKASIRHGPIEHGTPLMPYIPKHSPPPGAQPKRGG